MGTYEQLKAAVAAVIKDNGAEEITGDVLQQVLLTIINSVGAGATFAGVATPTTAPSTPDAKMFYLAGKAGTYVNFNITITKGLWVFENSTGSWVGHDLEVSMLFASGEDVTQTNIAAQYAGAGNSDLVTVSVMNEAIDGIIGDVALSALDSTRTAGLYRVIGVQSRVVGYLQVNMSLSGTYVIQFLASDISDFDDGYTADYKGHILTRTYSISAGTWTAWDEYGGGKFATGEKVADVSIVQTLGSSQTALPSQKTVSDAVLNLIDIGNIDAMKNDATLRTCAAIARYTATATLQGVTYKVGILDVMSDSAGHVLTQILTTHYTITNGVLDTSSHTDGAIRQYYRSVKINGGTLPTTDWTLWKPINDEQFDAISESVESLAARIGYYECSTAAATAAKTVAATGYTLENGGCIRIKMDNANTADSVTLNINSTGAKALYYDGEQASSTNSWDANEVLEVYYDGTQYQCASGGGGKFATGEKVKETSITGVINDSDDLITSGAVSGAVSRTIEVSPYNYDLTWEERWYARNGVKNNNSSGRNTVVDVRNGSQLVFKGSVGSTNNDMASILTYTDNNGEIGSFIAAYNAETEGALTTISIDGVGWIRYCIKTTVSYTPYLKIQGGTELLINAVTGFSQEINAMQDGGTEKVHYHNWQDGVYYNVRNISVGGTLPSLTQSSGTKTMVIPSVGGQKFFFWAAPASSTSQMWMFVDSSNKILSKGNTGFNLQYIDGAVAPPNSAALILCSRYFTSTSPITYVCEKEDPYRYDTQIGVNGVDKDVAELLKKENTTDIISSESAVFKVYSSTSGEETLVTTLTTNAMTVSKDGSTITVTRNNDATVTSGSAFFDISSLVDGRVYTIHFHATHVPTATITSNNGKVGLIRVSGNLYAMGDSIACNTNSHGNEYQYTFVKTSDYSRFGLNVSSLYLRETIVFTGFCVREYDGDVQDTAIEGLDNRITALESYVTEQTKHEQTVTKKDCFTVTVNIALPTLDTDAAVDGTPILGTDYGFCAMPDNYSPTGEPVRLVIFCHGAGIAKSNYTDNMSDVPAYMSYWLQLGYAVMDMLGLPYELSGIESGTLCEQHYGCPVTLQCYKKGYDYVLKNYNVKKDGVIVLGASMGGMSSFEIVQSGIFPVLCQISYCPVVELFKQAYCTPWNVPATQRANIAKYFGFVGTEPTWTSNTYPSAAEIQYFRDNLGKTVGYFPMMNNIVQGDLESIFDVIPNISTTAYSAEEAAIYDEFIAYQPCPIKIFHNLNDPLVAPRYSQYYIGMAKRSGAIAEYRTFSTGGHTAWDNGDDVTLTDIHGNTFTVKTSKAEAYWFAKRFEL